MTKKQTKNKSPKSTKKQPINVQLSKGDLVELLTVLKSFVQEELLRKERESERLASIERRRMQARITRLEIEKKAQEIKRITYCSCEYIFKSVQYHKVSLRPATITYKCRRCGMEWQKLPCFLTKKEKKALKNLGVEI